MEMVLSGQANIRDVAEALKTLEDTLVEEGLNTEFQREYDRNAPLINENINEGE